ncbi:MAG: ABC transporter permease [Lachnospiraceae bacterium]|nr:ABC transporter permease [Lachnospiraceae bacterium]
MEEKQEWMSIVEPYTGWFNIDIKGVWKYKDLIKLFVRRTFVAQYKQTILGPAWAIVQPFLTTVVYSLFFGNIAGLGAAGVPNFVFYLSGTIIWTLFANCLNSSANAFISNARILGKVYFPRLVMPISSSISQLISFGIQFLFLCGFLVYYSVTGVINVNQYFFMFPLAVLQALILGFGFGTILSSLTTKYRDLAMLVSFGLELWKFASPVAYDMFGRLSLAPGGKYYSFYMLNPVTPLINLFRYGTLGCGAVDWNYYFISWGETLVILFIGIVLFSRVEKTFMDTI